MSAVQAILQKHSLSELLSATSILCAKTENKVKESIDGGSAKITSAPVAMKKKKISAPKTPKTPTTTTVAVMTRREVTTALAEKYNLYKKDIKSFTVDELNTMWMTGEGIPTSAKKDIAMPKEKKTKTAPKEKKTKTAPKEKKTNTAPKEKKTKASKEAVSTQKYDFCNADDTNTETCASYISSGKVCGSKKLTDSGFCKKCSGNPKLNKTTKFNDELGAFYVEEIFRVDCPNSTYTKGQKVTHYLPNGSRRDIYGIEGQTFHVFLKEDAENGFEQASFVADTCPFRKPASTKAVNEPKNEMGGGGSKSDSEPVTEQSESQSESQSDQEGEQSDQESESVAEPVSEQEVVEETTAAAVMEDVHEKDISGIQNILVGGGDDANDTDDASEDGSVEDDELDIMDVVFSEEEEEEDSDSDEEGSVDEDDVSV
jgi:hypothetical protein